MMVLGSQIHCIFGSAPPHFPEGPRFLTGTPPREILDDR